MGDTVIFIVCQLLSLLLLAAVVGIMFWWFR
jgi:hypothetical protein